MPNRNILKVSYIIGYIFGIFACLTIFGALIGIPGILISVYIQKFYNMKDNEIEKNKERLFYLSILFALVSPISGVLALVYYIQLERYNINTLNKKHTNK